MKAILTVTTFFIIISLQAQIFNMGIKIGGNYTTLKSNNEAAMQYQQFNYKLGYDIGLLIKLRITFFGIQLEPGISNRGSRINDTNNYNLNYFTFPVLGALHPTKRFCILFGPEFSYLFSANEMERLQYSTKKELEYVFTNEMDVGINVGCAVLIGKHFGLEAKYAFGLLSSTNNIIIIDEYGNTEASITVKNRGLIVNLLFMFREFDK